MAIHSSLGEVHREHPFDQDKREQNRGSQDGKQTCLVGCCPGSLDKGKEKNDREQGTGRLQPCPQKPEVVIADRGAHHLSKGGSSRKLRQADAETDAHGRSHHVGRGTHPLRHLRQPPGRHSLGVEHLQKALQLWGRHTVQIQTADAHSVLAIAYNFMGNFALAEHHLSCAISCCDQLHDEKGKINNLIRMATSKQRQGAYADAETILTQILSEPTASILLQQKRYDEARIFFSALETSLKATGLKRELLRVKVRLAMCYLTGGGATDGRDRLHPGNAGLRAACAHGDTRYPTLISLSKRKRS